MKEIELKLHATDEDFDRVRTIFKFANGHRGQSRYVDVYYNHPVRSFLETNEWLRIRTITEEDGSARTYITYKGPKEGAARTEIEMEITPDHGKTLLELLGFQQLVVVSKTRSTALFNSKSEPYYIAISLDDVEHLGKFVELEIMGQSADVPLATKKLYELAASLKISQEEKRGYAQMLMS